MQLEATLRCYFSYSSSSSHFGCNTGSTGNDQYYQSRYNRGLGERNTHSKVTVAIRAAVLVLPARCTTVWGASVRQNWQAQRDLIRNCRGDWFVVDNTLKCHTIGTCSTESNGEDGNTHIETEVLKTIC